MKLLRENFTNCLIKHVMGTTRQQVGPENFRDRTSTFMSVTDLLSGFHRLPVWFTHSSRLVWLRSLNPLLSKKPHISLPERKYTIRPVWYRAYKVSLMAPKCSLRNTNITYKAANGPDKSSNKC